MRFVLSLFVAALGFFSPSTIQPPTIAEPLEVHVGIAPSIYDSMQLLKRATPNTYTCDALVIDDAKRVVAFAKLVAEPGRKETTKRVNGDFEVEFGVLIAPVGDHAETRVTVRRSGSVIMRQSSKIRLMNVSTKKYIPVQ
jgi:hypothetical protein